MNIIHAEQAVTAPATPRPTTVTFDGHTLDATDMPTVDVLVWLKSVRDARVSA